MCAFAVCIGVRLREIGLDVGGGETAVCVCVCVCEIGLDGRGGETAELPARSPPRC